MSAPVHDKAQRWRARRASYRPPGEVIDTRRHEVAPIKRLEAKAFVLEHHYSASFPAERASVGLFRDGELAGVAVFSNPMQPRVLDALPCGRDEGVELGRFVLLDQVETLGESWFLARAFELARERWSGVIMDSDPLERVALDGRVTCPGHVGTIYQASNAVYLGRTPRHSVRLLPDGRDLANRAQSKIRAKGRERGWSYAVELLVGQGAPSPGRDPSPEDLCAWLDVWREKLTRCVRHPGKHRYAFTLDPALRRVMARTHGPWRPYPRRAS